MQAVLLGLAFGGLNARLGLSQRSIQRRAALLMQAAINTAFIAMVRQLNGFPAERAVVRNEAARGTAPGAGGYGLLPYFLAKLCVEAPLDAFYPAVFGSVAASLAGLNKDRRAQLLGTLSLQGLAASALGLSVSALAPTAESALAIGPVLSACSPNLNFCFFPHSPPPKTLVAPVRSLCSCIVPSPQWCFQ